MAALSRKPLVQRIGAQHRPAEISLRSPRVVHRLNIDIRLEHAALADDNVRIDHAKLANYTSRTDTRIRIARAHSALPERRGSMGIPLYDTEVEETPVLVREIAEYLAGTFEGDGEAEITGAAQIEAAGANDVAFVGNRKAAQQAPSSAAGCLIVPPDFMNTYGRTVIRVAQPRTAFAGVVARLHPKSRPAAGIHPSAVIADSAEIEPGCSIGPHVSVGDDARVGKESVIGAGTRIGARVILGESCTLYANVTIYDDVEIGNRCVSPRWFACLDPDGFGYVTVDNHYEKFPQVGRVTLGDDVEIGANSCVDRAALGVTSIGDGSSSTTWCTSDITAASGVTS